ncbi:MAG: hypothetical protein LBF97_03405 [Elusimicrobiota bacterium]|jgi:hypothetical protein|nr:hypothetical protein [Elusimicrobiota bacterium]
MRTKKTREKKISFRKKRGNIWYVYWRENGKEIGISISPDLQAAKEFQRELDNRV